MLAAAPLSAIVAGVTVATGAVADPQVDFSQVAALFGLILLAVWGVLGLNKVRESLPLDRRVNRLTGFGLGATVAAALMGLQQWTHLDIGPLATALPRPELAHYIGPVADSAWPGILELATCFGLAFGLVGWWKQTDRARGSRFRIWPVVTTGLVAAVTTALWEGSPVHLWVPPILIGTAVVTQWVSPWDRQAAQYARWARKNKVQATA
jgi:hypothetical protein